ncbi:hypothetical protein Peur_052023 [Populus x canadensis]
MKSKYPLSCTPFIISLQNNHFHYLSDHALHCPLHFFEGDGTFHSFKLSGGQTEYCSRRYVKTYKYMLEKEAGFPIFSNMLSGFYSLAHILVLCLLGEFCVAILINLMRGFGVANTSLAFFSHKLLALGESDLPYVIDLAQEGNVETLGRWILIQSYFALHCKPLIFPYITYFYFNEDGVKQKDVHLLSINQLTPIHDFAITKQFAIFPETRIGILPRYARNDKDMRWFPVRVVLVAPDVLNIENVFQKIGKVHFSLEKLTINMRTRKVLKKILSKRSLELGSINASYVGKNNRYAYLGIAEKIPKIRGWWLCRDLWHDETSGESNFIAMDAKSPSLDIVENVKLPRRVPWGFHSLFLNQNNLSNNW